MKNSHIKKTIAVKTCQVMGPAPIGSISSANDDDIDNETASLGSSNTSLGESDHGNHRNHEILE